jgi:hypothetical protein
MRAVCKVHELTLLLWVGTLWRCGDSLLFKVPPLASDALLTTLHPFLKNMLMTVDHLKISCLVATFHGWKSPEVACGKIWTEFCVWLGKRGSMEPHQNIHHTVQISSHVISGLFQPWKGSSEARTFKLIHSLQHIFEKWVEHCKKCIACQRRYFEKETVTAPPQVPTWSNKVSLQTLQMAPVVTVIKGKLDCKISIHINTFYLPPQKKNLSKSCIDRVEP